MLPEFAFSEHKSVRSGDSEQTPGHGINPNPLVGGMPGTNAKRTAELSP